MFLRIWYDKSAEEVKSYNEIGQVFTLTTGVLIPIAQTQSIAQGISQFFGEQSEA